MDTSSVSDQNQRETAVSAQTIARTPVAASVCRRGNTIPPAVMPDHDQIEGSDGRPRANSRNSVPSATAILATMAPSPTAKPFAIFPSIADADLRMINNRG